MISGSPYAGKTPLEWKGITKSLLNDFPLSPKTLIQITLDAWKDIFHSEIGQEKFRIGKDIFPRPQIMGFLLHELIPLKLHSRFSEWKKDKEVTEKDIVYTPDIKYSLEIKTSSHRNRIFGNRSYAQPTDNSKKDKSGYFLAINFEKFSENPNPRIKLIRFGWLDHTDWIGQRAATGQQAHLRSESEENKLLVLYRL